MICINLDINAYYTITASPEFREKELLREKVRHDEAQTPYHAGQKGIQKGALDRSFEIARNALQMGMAIDDIAKLTGLAHDEIERLKN